MLHAFDKLDVLEADELGGAGADGSRDRRVKHQISFDRRQLHGLACRARHGGVCRRRGYKRPMEAIVVTSRAYRKRHADIVFLVGANKP